MIKKKIGLPIAEWRKKFGEDSGLVNNVVRQLAFAGIAIVWVFHSSKPNEPIIPDKLNPALQLIAICVILELTQFLWKSVGTYLVFKIPERQVRKGKKEEKTLENLDMPDFVPFISWILFLCKIAALALAYLHIYNYILPNGSFDLRSIFRF